MTSFDYTKSETGWPLKASSNGTLYEFSGNFTSGRVRSEKIGNALNIASLVLLWSISLAGLAVLGLGGWQAWLEQDLLFLTRTSAYNQAFWVSTLASLYLFAKLKQRQLDNQALNLLKQDYLAGTTTDIYKLYSRDARRAWNRAFLGAARRGSLTVTGTDIFLSLLEEGQVQHAFLRFGVSSLDIKTFLKHYLKVAKPDESPITTIPFAAFSISLKLHNRTIDPLMILCALAQEFPEDHIVRDILFNINVDSEKLETVASWISHLRMIADDIKIFKKLARFKPDNEINKGLTSVPTFYLDRFSQDLTFQAKHGRLPIALGRGDDLHELFKLFSSGRQNVLIKGQPGSGRTTLINELAYKMAAEQVPALLEDKRLVKLDIASILAGSRKTEQVFVNALAEATRSGNVILVIEDIHQLARNQTQDGLTLMEVLVNYLEANPLSVIGTTTLEDYSDYLRNTSNFNGVFMNYELTELSRSGILLACSVRASILEHQNECFFFYQAIEQAVLLTDLYVKGVGQPQKAIAVLVEAASRIKNEPKDKRIVTDKVIERIVSEKTHIPEQTLSQEESEKLLTLESQLQRNVIGQQAAIKAVTAGLQRARSGLTSGNRPLASFLFVGPTGVGKTEIARQLSKIYFGEEKYLLRVDMSEFQGDNAIEKFLGSETRKTDTAIVRHLKNYPFCLLLLDEFEKASPNIINLFLQILEDGRLTSGKGELLDLTQCLIIATSNAGTKDIQEGQRSGRTMDQIKTQIFNQTLTKHFPPELLNRFDSVVLFSPLSQAEIERVTVLQLNSLIQQMLAKGIHLSFTEAATKDIATNAYDPLLGARPIRRYIQDHIEPVLATMLLKKKLARGSSVTVDFSGGYYRAQ